MMQQDHAQAQMIQQHQQAQAAHAEPKGGGVTSLAAHHAASKLAAMATTGDKQLPLSASAKTSPATSRSGSISQQGPFEGQTTIAGGGQTEPTPARQQPQQQAPFPARPVSSRGHMLPQSAQMISEKERQREAELEHIFTPQPGQIIAERYEFIKLLGRGTFSQVLQCRDLAAPLPTDDDMSEADSNASSSSSSSGSGLVTIPLKPKNYVAIKVIRDVARYRHAAEKEARILQHLAASKHTPFHPARPHRDLQTARGMQQDSNSGVYGVNPLLGWFRLGGHFCLVFPPLGCSLYDFLRANHFRPLFPHHIRHIAEQLLTTCAGLHQLGVVHADIKPENILLVAAEYTTVQIQQITVNVPLCTDVRMTDFGTAVFDNHEKPMIVVSRSYRPLEVVLGLEWSFGVDLWAIGCVLMELYTGHRLFNISSQADDIAHVRLMEQMLGPVPLEIKSRSRLWSSGANNWISPAPSPRESPHPSPAQSPASTPPGSPRSRARQLAAFPMLKDRVVPSDTHFLDLISRMLDYDQNTRISAIEALQHPYFRQQ